MKPPVFPTSLLLISLLTPALLSARTWTNHEGRTIEAELVEANGDSVMLLVGDERFEVALTDLSQADRDFVAEWRENGQTAGSGETREFTDLGECEMPYGFDGLPFPIGWDRTLGLDANVPESFESIDRVEIEVVEEDADANSFQYQSEHFLFSADRQLTNSVVEAVATLLEATYDSVAQMPWGMPIARSQREDGRIDVSLFFDEQAYLDAGGIPNSGGTARGTQFLVLLSQIGVRTTGGTDGRVILDDIENSSVLTHEMTHVLRNIGDAPLPIWAIEGFATYMETFEYSDRGVYERHDPLERVAIERGSTLIMPVPLDEFLIESQQQFSGGVAGQLTADAYSHYHAAMLLMTYFWEADNPGNDERPGEPIRAYLRALYEGEDPAGARRHLLAGRSWEELQEEIERAVGRYVEVRFAPLSAEVAEPAESAEDK